MNRINTSEIKGSQEVQKKWKLLRVKDIFILERGKFTHRPRNDERMYNEGHHPFIQTGDVSNSNKYVLKYKQTLNEYGIRVSRKFSKGTLLMTIAANIGDVAILGFDAYFPDSIVAFKTKQSVDYYYYLLSITKKDLDVVKITNTQDNLNLERLNGLSVICPPLNEQISIANYLDDKTRIIDKKIGLIEKKVEYYQELIKSLVSETVLKGFNKNVRLKDSKIEWIGNIPIHWDVERAKQLFKEINSRSLSGDGDLLSVSEYYGIAKKNDVIGDDEYISRAETLEGYKKCVKDDLIINIMLAWKSGLGISPYDGLVSPSYAVYRKDDQRVYPLYFHYLLRTNHYTADFKRNSKGIIDSRLRLYSDRFYSTPLLLPPFEEQVEIVLYLEKNIKKIDKIIKNLKTQIITLKELRKRLINDVVTGKIKVT